MGGRTRGTPLHGSLKNVNKILIHIVVTEVFGFLFRKFVDGILQLHCAGFFKNATNFFEVFVVDFAKHACSGFVEVSAHTVVKFREIAINPFPHRTLFGVKVGFYAFGYNAVALMEDIVVEHLVEGILLTTALRLGKVSEFLRIAAEHIDHKSWHIVSWAAGFATHTLTAEPNKIRFEEFFEFGIVLSLHNIEENTRVVVRKLRRRAHRRAYTAVHTRIESLFVAYVLFQDFA